ncbi:MAG TPA: condensation domain-containing protein, partial [Pyrinomonadaceae bacterium]|nr:condensation domain-containing protein [Pyrinomonadaceae bacterium]
MQEILIQEPMTKPLRRVPNERNNFPLSYAQQRLWFLDQLEPGSTAYIIPGSMRFKGPLNVSALEQALTEIVRRHEVLRTSFRIVNGQPVQSIAAPQPFILSRRDLRDLSETEREARVEQLMNEDSLQSFDLSRGPLIRAQLLLLAEHDHVLIPSMHHIISDGWSLSVFLNELATLYRAFLKGEPSPLAELEVQYADYSVWQRDYLHGEVIDQQLAYWRKQLAGAPPALDFPTDRPRPAIQTMEGGIVRYQISRELLEQLYATSRASGVTLFMTLLAAFKVLLARYSGQSDIVVGSPIAGRVLKETEPLIGNFLNTLVLRTDVSGDPSFKDLVKRVKEVTLEAYANQDVPFEKLVEDLQPVRDLSRSPFFQVMFILLNHPALKLELPDLTLLPIKRETEKVKYDVTLMVVEGEKGLRVEFEYNTELFERSTIERLIGH